MVKLTKLQKIIYDTIVEYKEKNDGCSPSLLVLRDILVARADIDHITGQAIGVHITKMPELLERDVLGSLHVIGGQWTLAERPEIEEER